MSLGKEADSSNHWARGRDKLNMTQCKRESQLGMVAHYDRSSTQEVEAEGS